MLKNKLKDVRIRKIYIGIGNLPSDVNDTLVFSIQLKQDVGIDTVMEDVVSGRKDKEWLVQTWTQDIEDTLGIRVHEAGGLITSQESF